MDIVGTWRLVTWRRYEPDGGVTYPFGEHPNGILVYTPDGFMAVQMVRADRSALDTQDALGGTEAERAAAYSGCLAYFGRYRLEDGQVVHLLDGSLFPNWSNTTQVRPLEAEGGQLLLKVEDSDGRVTNDISWRRPEASTATGDVLTRFVRASTRLTGFGRIELVGTGLAAAYLETVQAAVPQVVLHRLLSRIGNEELGEAGPSRIAEVLAAPDLGPVARSIIVLWYCGKWKQLPDGWHGTYGGDGDETHVVSAEAYLSGLQWKVMGAHASGGNMQGFGAWSLAPEGVEE